MFSVTRFATGSVTKVDFGGAVEFFLFTCQSILADLGVSAQALTYLNSDLLVLVHDHVALWVGNVVHPAWGIRSVA